MDNENKNKFAALIAASTVAFVGCSENTTATDGSSEPAQYELVQASEAECGPLNPARGDASPRACDLWGDRTEDRASGFLVKFDSDFSSPPHIHNITYRAVVIDGLLHNDDPTAAKMWLPEGSYWSQPLGQDHVTAANGEVNMAYLEIDSGPYLVMPTSEAFESDEVPLNIDRSNLSMMGSKAAGWIETDSPFEIAPLWVDDNDREAAMLRLPAGQTASITTDEPAFKGVSVTGAIAYASGSDPDEIALETGSYFGSSGDARHVLTCNSDTDCIAYLRTESDPKIAAE
ncbi:MAG: DUF4437 domain-containing protein [Pseudomonadota bacterium]|nr:DUF4437 domain-containing protein [Pseudomonadota bacterium]